MQVFQKNHPIVPMPLMHYHSGVCGQHGADDSFGNLPPSEVFWQNGMQSLWTVFYGREFVDETRGAGPPSL